MSADFVFGIHAVSALFERAPEDVLELFILKDKDDQRLQPLLKFARDFGVSVQYCNRRALDEKVNGAQHQGVVAKARAQQSGNEQDLARIVSEQSSPFILILDGITDPHNLGAIYVVPMLPVCMQWWQLKTGQSKSHLWCVKWLVVPQKSCLSSL